MYEQFYRLSGLPFSLLPDADFLYPSRRHRKAINLLEYGMMSRAGFVVLTGEVGAGKTTIIRRFLKLAGPDKTLGVVTNPSKSLGALMNWIALAFELEEASNDTAKTYHRFVAFLVEQYAKGKSTVLIIDEAQNLDMSMLEELRMLSNVNNEKDQLLQIVLVGQPELLETLNRPELRQFAQRIAVHCHLAPLTPRETAAYIRHRLGLVGGEETLFDDSACAAAHFFSGGVPRLINLLADQALVYGFSEDKTRITSAIVSEVAGDRAQSGLSAFRPVEKDFTSQISGEIAGILQQIRSGREEGA